MKDINAQVVDLAGKISEKRGNPVLILNLIEVNKGSALNLHDHLAGRDFQNLDVILQTPGGDIDAAFSIAKILRNKTKKRLSVMVPLFAKSAGTLICFVGNEILMNDLSELGPLDSQIPEMQDGGEQKYVSALNGFKALEQVQIHSIETLDLVAKFLLGQSNLKVPEAVQLATDFSGKTSGTLYSRLDPIRIGEYARALEVGERYGITILTRYMNWTREDAERVVKILVKQYPSHGFVIDAKELCDLGLPACEFEGDLLDSIVLMRKLLLQASSPIIELIDCSNKKTEKKKT